MEKMPGPPARTPTPTARSTPLAIGCFAALCRDQLADRLVELAADWPGADVGVHDMSRPELLANVRDGSLALAILPGERCADLFSRVVMIDRVMVAMSASHPLSKRTEIAAEDLCGARVLVPQQRHDRELHRFLAGRLWPSPKFTERLCGRDFEQVLNGVAAGEGIALTCDSWSGEYRDVVVRPVASANARYAVSLYWREDRPIGALAALIDRLCPPDTVVAPSPVIGAVSLMRTALHTMQHCL